MSPTDHERFDVPADASVGGFDAKFVDVNGVRTRYYEEGEEHDELLVLVHGGIWGSSSSANTWVPVLDALSERYHVLAPDRITCGLTGNPTDESAYDWEFTAEVEHVRDFLDTKGVDACHFCGSSRGMASVSWLAVEHPERVDTIVCTNSNTLAPASGDYGHRRVALSRGGPPATDDASGIVDELRHQLTTWHYAPDRTLDEEHVRARAYMETRPDSKEATAFMDAGGIERIEHGEKFELMDDIRAGLPKGAIAQPILLYWSRHDLTATRQMGLDLYERISQGNPNVRLHLVDRAGHLPYLDFPEEFVATVTTFTDHWTDNARSMEDVRPREYAEYYKSD